LVEENEEEASSIHNFCSSEEIMNKIHDANTNTNLINIPLDIKTAEISKLELNRAKRKRQKNNRKVKNEERVKLGLSKLPRNKGKKRKLRGEVHRQKLKIKKNQQVAKSINIQIDTVLALSQSKTEKIQQQQQLSTNEKIEIEPVSLSQNSPYLSQNKIFQKLTWLKN
jgi:hypothetical protein